MKELILKKITSLKHWTLGIFITCIILMWLCLVILLYYNSSDDSSYLDFSLLLILFMSIIFTAMGIFILKFFQAYITTVNKLSDKESSIFVERGSYRSFAEKWLPSFIIYQDKVKFFKVLNQPEYEFTQIKSIRFKRFNFTRSGQDCTITIQMVNGMRHHFYVNGNLHQRNHLIDEALRFNPQIIIDDRY